MGIQAERRHSTAIAQEVSGQWMEVLNNLNPIHPFSKEPIQGTLNSTRLLQQGHLSCPELWLVSRCSSPHHVDVQAAAREAKVRRARGPARGTSTSQLLGTQREGELHTSVYLLRSCVTATPTRAYTGQSALASEPAGLGSNPTVTSQLSKSLGLSEPQFPL